MPSHSLKGRGLTASSELRHSAEGLGEPRACAPWQSARVLHGSVSAAAVGNRAALSCTQGRPVLPPQAPRVTQGILGLKLLTAGAASPQLR